jgi:hypothetical protein
MWVIFSLIQSLHLAILYWSTWSKLGMVVNMKVVDLDMVLDDMALVDQVWFKKSQMQGCKVVKIL